jgi:DNA-binding CsgD family transcriptional regulator
MPPWTARRWISPGSSRERPSSASSTSSRTPTPPGLEHAERYEDITEILAAGIDVFSTVNVQHLGSRNDAVHELGQRIHRRSRAGASATGGESLTERELEIVRLIVDRRTNRQIAEELFLSPKTVETHAQHLRQAGRGVAGRGWRGSSSGPTVSSSRPASHAAGFRGRYRRGRSASAATVARAVASHARRGRRTGAGGWLHPPSAGTGRR